MERQKPYGYIYKIEFPNGKVYIGLTTTSLKRRKSGHRNCAKGNDTRILYNALRRYTMEDTFELMEIDTADTEEELCEKEIMYISKYNSFDIKYGYNMTLGGEGTNGWVPTQEQKRKNSETKKKYFQNLVHLEKTSYKVGSISKKKEWEPLYDFTVRGQDINNQFRPSGCLFLYLRKDFENYKKFIKRKNYGFIQKEKIETVNIDNEEDFIKLRFLLKNRKNLF